MLEEVDHPGELSRLIYVFHRLGRNVIGMQELVELADRTAGSGYRYPKPESALRLALDLGLVIQTGASVTLTQRGELFSQKFAANPVDLSIEQGKLILGILLDEYEFRSRVEGLLARFSQGSGSKEGPQAHAALLGADSEAQRIAIFLQQVGALEYRDDMFFVRAEFEDVLQSELLSTAKLDEETLWKRLEAQRLRARAAEEYVLEYERVRLVKLGRADLSELVTRISAVDVSAGYDVRSFEVDGSPRYVEVKSSTGRRVRFEWSAHERTIAAQMTKLYWVYFVPVVHTLPKLSEGVIQIQDPLAEIAAGHLVETASSLLVMAASPTWAYWTG